MALIVEFICELPNGVHARPASHVETLCNTFSSQIEWHNLRTDRKGNAKSALALIGTDTLVGDNCQLLISGADEQEAHQRLSQWLRDEFPHCDAPLAEVKSDELEPLPVSLTNLNPQIIRARTVCSGREADLWAREAVFSTGLGFSFAIPHSKSEHIEQSTISVARLQAPVRWGDDEAQFIIMLTLNKHAAGDQHMRIFSRLARRIMHEEFRNALVNAASADAIASLLQHELEL
ncbi:TPA: PTS transporter subunit EIIA [Escherichia coli]|nr:PTS transporter subunit EIIA [Escherichia coli]HBA8428737.1 PTS transporter subunit EIIA [Escherichia coli]HBA8436357.1 PTS transporter subunit EIIA [Escherichia coli]HBA9819150.1 PTS transporter subunit EIIA [Escherichia coli]HBB0137819.1 PTS transporter subunit EIIA [Escherichia coli]